VATGLSDRRFAKLAGVSRQAVAKARRVGRLVADNAGWLDPTHQTNAAFITSHETRMSGTRGTEVQVRALLAKARWLATWLERHEAAHYDRKVLAERWRAAAFAILEAIPKIPDRYTPWFADAIGKPEAVARQILERCVTLLLRETAHFPDEAFHTAMRLP
jgi:hypothetical protein